MTQERNDDSRAAEHAPGTDARPGTLKALAALGAASALWAVFLWRELVRARAGETPFCGFGESADCGTLWSAAFATTVHDATGVPVAGWGLVWSLVATLLPILALAWRGCVSRAAAASSAVELTAAAGVAGIAVLLAASAAEGLFCTSCAATYLLTLAYGTVTFSGLSRRTRDRPPHGVTLAAAATAAAYVALLYPGLKTPKSLTEEGQRALAAMAERRVDATGEEPPAAVPEPASGEGRERRYDGQLRDFLASLPPQALQGLSDSLFLFRNAPALAPEEPRVMAAGSAEGRVLITEFTDVLCSHCATLHQTMAYLSTLLPPDSFRLDARHFPLDGNCNPHLQVRGPESVRCMAARAQICLEGSGQASQLAGVLFEHQRDLTTEQAFQLTAPFVGRQELEACMADPATARKLRDDVEYAWRYEPEGTPLVLIDGRRGTQFGPFLYAMVLTGGDPDHPAFAVLPPPSPQLATTAG